MWELLHFIKKHDSFYFFLKHSAVWSVTSQPLTETTIQRNISLLLRKQGENDQLKSSSWWGGYREWWGPGGGVHAMGIEDSCESEPTDCCCVSMWTQCYRPSPLWREVPQICFYVKSADTFFKQYASQPKPAYGSRTASLFCKFMIYGFKIIYRVWISLLKIYRVICK